MDQNNELNDIILNKGASVSSNKKIIFAVATLGVILIIVVMLMNSLSSNSNENLPQVVLPPQPQTNTINEVTDEPLFEEIEVVEEPDTTESNLDAIAQKLKQESFEESKKTTVVQAKPKKVEAPKATPKPVVRRASPKKETPKKSVSKGEYYIQVGSFSKYQPNKKFLKSITQLGFNYKYHKVVRNSTSLNKVLVGPFKTDKEAKQARRVLRAKVEPGAFLVKI